MILGQLVVVDAIDDGQIRAFRRRGNQDALGARLEMGRRLLARGEDAGAFERDVDAERLVRKLGRILDRGHLHLVAVDDDRVALDLDLVRKAPMHAVEAQEMRVGLDRTQIVDGDDLDVLAARLRKSRAATSRPIRPKPLIATLATIPIPPPASRPHMDRRRLEAQTAEAALIVRSPSEVYRLRGKCDISFDLPQSRPLVLTAARNGAAS